MRRVDPCTALHNPDLNFWVSGVTLLGVLSHECTDSWACGEDPQANEAMSYTSVSSYTQSYHRVL